MAITIGGKSYNSYEEQILENKEKIEKMEKLTIKRGEQIPTDKTRTYITCLKEWSEEGIIGRIEGVDKSVICSVDQNTILTITNREGGRAYIYRDKNVYYTQLFSIYFQADYESELQEI